MHAGYEEKLPGAGFIGTTVGRYANRIKDAKFALDGTEYKLSVNNGPNHLHGGTHSRPCTESGSALLWDGTAWYSAMLRETMGCRAHGVPHSALGRGDDRRRLWRQANVRALSPQL